MLDADPWPLALLVLRIATVGLLYIFLLTAFRALRADLRASSAPERTRTSVPAAAAQPVEAWTEERGLPATRAYPPADERWDDPLDDEWEQPELPFGGSAEGARRSRVRPRVWLPVTAAILVAAFGGTALLLAQQQEAPGVGGRRSHPGLDRQRQDAATRRERGRPRRVLTRDGRAGLEPHRLRLLAGLGAIGPLARHDRSWLSVDEM